jgi:hypothetical protein
MDDGSSEQPISAIRVLLADMPDVLYDELALLIQAEHDLLLVGRVSGPVELLLRADEGVDVVMLATGGAEGLPGVGTHLLAEYPDLKLLVLPPDRSVLTAYWRGLRSERLGPGASDVPHQIRQIHRRNPLE